MNIDSTARSPKQLVLKADAADVIAMAFFQVGYRPRESLIVVGLHGPRQQIGLVSRVDLPPARLRRRVIAQQLELLSRQQERQIIGMVVSDVPPPMTSSHPVPLPHRPLVRELRRQAERAGLEVIDVLAIDDSRWRSYRCRTADCCPPEGRSLEAALTGPVATQLVALGRVLAPDEQALVADVEPAASEARRPRPRRRDARLSSEEAAAALARWRELLARPELATMEDYRRLAEALADCTVRDAILLTLSPAAGTTPDAVLAGADSADVDPSCLDAALGAAPDDDLLERGRILLSAVARSAPPGRRADALALLAWSAWWSGHGSRGRLLAERALGDDPGHRLARLVDQVLRLSVPPPWADRSGGGRRRRRAAGGSMTGS